MIAYYGPLHWETSGEIMVWGITIAILWAGAFYFRGSTLLNPDRPRGEAYFTAFAYTLILSNTVIAGVFLVGLVFLATLHVVSGFWAFWGMFYLLSIPIVFHVFPVLTLIAWSWSLIGWWRMRYAARVMYLATLLTLALALSAGSYFALELGFRNG